jgi:hypothetical protein
MSDSPKTRGHSMPQWAAWLQDNVLLSVLMAAEGYIFGILLITGWVPDIQNPNTWGLFRGLGVPLFFGVGIAAGGLAVRCSFKAANAFTNNHWGTGTINMFGLFIVCTAEVWCSLAERSQNLQPTPADNTVLAMFNIANSSISPTIIIIAVLVPSLSLFWGFAQEHIEVQIETPEELEAKQKREIMLAKHRGEMTAIRARNTRKGIAALAGKEEEIALENAEESNEEQGANTQDVPPENVTVLAPNNRKKDWTWRDYQSYVSKTFGVSISRDLATKTVQDIGENRQATNQRGSPYVALNAPLKRHAKSLYGGSNATENSAERA